MELLMYLGNDLLESVPLHFSSLSLPGYVGNIKRKLNQKHSELIQQTSLRPEFLVVDLQPASAAQGRTTV